MYLQVGGSRFGVRTTSAAFADWLDLALSDYRVAGPAPIRYSVVVAGPPRGRSRGVNILYSGAAPVLRTMHLPALAGCLLTEIEAMLLPRRDDAVYIRAVPALAHGRTALVPTAFLTAVAGQTRGAKRMGLAFAASSVVAVDPASGLISPIRPALAVAGEARSALSSLASEGEDDHARVGEGVRVDVVYTTGTGAGAAEISLPRPVSKASALHRMTPSVLNLRAVGAPAFRALARLVGGAACLSLDPPGGRVRTLEVIAAGMAGTGSAAGP